eukprot:5274520-Amphidinium_carterae.1
MFGTMVDLPYQPYPSQVSQTGPEDKAAFEGQPDGETQPNLWHYTPHTPLAIGPALQGHTQRVPSIGKQIFEIKRTGTA